MNGSWRQVMLADVLTLVQRPEVPVPGKKYRQLGVRLWGAGAYEREPLDGAVTKYRTLSRVEADDVVVNKIWARNGSVAVVQPELSGCLVSGEFPTFRPNLGDLYPRWMHWLTKTPDFWAECDAKSRGTSGKNRIRPERFQEIEIPLPPLAEQRRVVARIERLAGRIAETRSLRRQAAEDADALLTAGVTAALEGPWPRAELCEVVDSRRPVTYGIVQAGPHVEDGVPYIRVTDMAKPTLTLTGMLRTDSAIAARYERSRVAAGDIVFAIRATVGKMRFVPSELDGANLTQGTARIAPSEKAIGPFLYWALRSGPVVEAIESSCKGSTFREITLGRLRTLTIPLPPVPEQRRIARSLNAYQATVHLLTQLQAATAREVDALLPSILDKAFKGEL